MTPETNALPSTGRRADRTAETRASDQETDGTGRTLSLRALLPGPYVNYPERDRRRDG
ncbi:hypothetical protein [Halomicrococcus sp. SG-WS-1]|uniref:hypothetical protein n=1 Tax=Halomicrococcus sp. SG-WS-1 TaxID=3439057 RepID=UPI003F7A13EF